MSLSREKRATRALSKMMTLRRMRMKAKRAPKSAFGGAWVANAACHADGAIFRLADAAECENAAALSTVRLASSAAAHARVALSSRTDHTILSSPTDPTD